jgi:pimeloyl-ACP methyl ester carboxylesterase
VFWESYKPILRALHDARWARYLTRCFDLPVYACGYDWRASAEAGGKRLAEKVHEIRKTYGDACKQVILVTHSMGGLVARSACKLSGLAPHVLGIVHVVQPATGAPAAYWRLKAGFERKGFIDPVAYTLGTDGREVTSMLANMPGGLQLLPNREHRTNEGSPAWLKLISEDGKVTALPQKGDPYEEIYREEKGEWRLIRWKEYIAGHKPGAAGPEEASRAWSRFRGHLKNAERFHAALGDYRHPLTHHIYGTKNATVETVTLKIDKRLRRSKVPFGTGGMGRSWKTFADESDERGTFKVFFGPETDRDHFTQQSCMQMGPPEGDGDSTVPRYSATYLARADGQGGRFVFGKYDFEQTGTPVERAGHDTVFQESPKAVVTVIRCVTGLLLYRIRQTGAG